MKSKLASCFLAAIVTAALFMSGTAAAASFVLPPPDIDVIGATSTVRAREEDTLLDIAREHGLGYEDIVRANPDTDPWLPGEGTEVLLPTRFILPPGPRKGIVLNLPELRMYYYPPAKSGEVPMVETHPISIGRMDWATPLGQTKIVTKVRNPAWYPPESIRKEHAEDGDILPNVVPPGPDNPLGGFAMRLSIPGYLIHSTNKPAGVGMRVTHGCIRMYPENIEALFEVVPVGTPVRIINEPYKVGWSVDSLYLEAHPPLDEDAERIGRDLTIVTELLVKATSERNIAVDWDRIGTIFETANGVPDSMAAIDAAPIRVSNDNAAATEREQSSL
ncbi:MAG: L,D-transpeptidase family protein [Chromatiales bacterium]|jgi:L,D-transpeptidase ErfK/SrfK|nr:L,D-transpeptidase family protein [Chromatiales bacterium]MDH3893075.1 L,D-transpeptidase family protein [Chromatiales bacterium]MDH3930901.1 L,D-transpeptidase family protein [Chromatiales bacterium]MDH4014222.1 L,D-transpeptidase family protein [Chromatiales bacterium]